MSSRRSGSTLRTASLVVLALFVGLALLLWLLPSAPGEEARSVFSVEPGGWRAAFRLLDELGWHVAAWTEAPSALESDHNVLFLSGVPEEPLGLSSKGAGTPPALPPGTRRLRDPLHYLRFVQEGGTLVVPLTKEHSEFLAETLGFAEIATLETARSKRTELILPSGETRRVKGVRRLFQPLDPGSPFAEIAATADGNALAVTERVGHGRLVLFSSGDFLDNDTIDQAENAVVLVRLMEDLRPVGTVLFDEYSLGGWTPESPLQLAFAPGARLFTLHLLALALLGAWCVSWARQFPRDPEPLEQLAPLDRARAHAGWVAAVGRYDLLARMLQAGVLRTLARRGGTVLRRPAATEADEGDTGEAVHLRPDEDTARAALAPFAAELGGEARLEGAVELFTRSSVSSAEDLERLARGIARLEATLGAQEEEE